jgi:competence protein ComEA
VHEWLDSGRNWLASVMIVACLGAGVALAYPLVQRPAAPPVQLVATPPAPTPLPTEIQVHVTGAVEQPGLYALPAGSRIGDAITAAGLAADANPDGLNLAARLSDGQRLAVPRQGEPTTIPAPAPAASGGRAASPTNRAATAPDSRSAPRSSGPAATDPLPPGARLNLNTATSAQLDALPGIGPAYAQRILDHRERNGPFRTVQQLRDARVIPNATYDRIKDLITAE